eukprot:TRINITY_DN4386_c0_g1_i2.p2 TRINITY_DN4386_c0_g1~~TRINITY_DN4386_c0_g1_i2.p2  ORF type:complete len:168 (-),score=22.80 TRINITY_DN4386_c0_g1_i2:78-551(-)
MISKYPRIVNVSSQKQQQNWDFLMKELQFAEEEKLREFLISKPILLTKDLCGQAQQEKIKFFEKYVGLSFQQAFQKTQQWLNQNLQDKIGPRCWIIANSKDCKLSLQDLGDYLTISDEAFVEKVNSEVTNVEDYKQSIREWQEKQWPQLQSLISVVQ